jgi:hypothetical protein
MLGFANVLGLGLGLLTEDSHPHGDGSKGFDLRGDGGRDVVFSVQGFVGVLGFASV